MLLFEVQRTGSKAEKIEESKSKLELIHTELDLKGTKLDWNSLVHIASDIGGVGIQKKSGPFLMEVNMYLAQESEKVKNSRKVKQMQTHAALRQQRESAHQWV